MLIDKRDFGLINGRETGAVVPVTDSGGSGTFYDLELIMKEEKKWVNTDAVLLGDRVKIQAVEIKNGRIIISMMTHGPDDPMCCPTLEVVNEFTVKENKFVPVTDGPSRKNIPKIIGTIWKWEQTLYNNDTKTIPPEAKEGSSIAIHITQTTRAMCRLIHWKESFCAISLERSIL